MIFTHVLPVTSLHHHISLRATTPVPVTTSSPALDAVFDYRVLPPLTLSPGVTAEAAEIAMLYSHTNLQLVTDTNHNLLGIISIRDISGDKMLATAAAMGVARQDLTVKDLMTPVTSLSCMRQEILNKATVGDIVAILENQKQRFLLVIDADEQLRGLICADEIARLLGRELNILPVANYFGEVFSALRVHT